MRARPGAAVLVASVLALAGCAAGEDRFGAPGAGYVEDAAGRAEAVDWSTAESVTVTLSEFAFSPATLTFRAGAPYRLILENAGGQTHFFVSRAFFKSIAARELRSGEEAVSAPRLEKIALAPGATKELSFVATETGTFDLVCTAFLHELFGMTGSVQVL